MRDMSDTAFSIRATDLASKANISLAYASQLLRGQRKPTLEMARRLEADAGVPIEFWPRPRIEPVKRVSPA